MYRSGLERGLAERALDNLLPEGFDADVVGDFFAGGGEAVGRPAQTFLEIADERAAADLAGLARPLAEIELDGPTDDGGLDMDGVRPEGKGGGNAGGGGGTKGGGKGKNKDGTTDGGTTDGSTGDGSTGDSGTGTGDSGTGGTGTGDTGTGDSGGYGAGNYVSGLDTPDGFNIEIVFTGDWTAAMKQALYDVTETISDIIIGDLPSYNGIDDFRLTADASPIDGAGNWLGLGGATAKRPDTYLPYEGKLRVDTADAETELALGTFDDVVFHEVIHALGFGSIFDNLGLVKTINGQARFVGENATAAYNTLFADIAAGDADSDKGVPLAADESHWLHGLFTRELMTTSLYNSGNYLSDMSIAALEDMGYDTVFDISDLPLV